MLPLATIKISKILSLKNLQNKKYMFSTLIIVVILFLFFTHVGKSKPNADALSNSDNQGMKAKQHDDYTTGEKFLILDPNQGYEPSKTEEQVTTIATTKTTPTLGLWERIGRDMTKSDREYNYNQM